MARICEEGAVEPGSHRLGQASFVGGFLDGVALEFPPGLTCLIGSRGAGKSTIIEFIRYAINAFPEDGAGTSVRKNVESLVAGNLAGGRIELQFKTRQGLVYTVSRSEGDKPVVVMPDGQPGKMSPRMNETFQLDIYSQNEIEGIASDPRSQLALIDSFAQDEIGDIDARLRQVQGQLETNAAAMLDARGELSDSTTAWPIAR